MGHGNEVGPPILALYVLVRSLPTEPTDYFNRSAMARPREVPTSM